MTRPATDDDAGSIRTLLNAAFAPSRFESNLVDAVLSGTKGFHHWLTEVERRVVAYVLYTPAYREKTAIGYHLAPIAVDPAFQRRGIGSNIIRKSLNMPPIQSSAVFVLGDPKFYERFGFQTTTSAVCPYDPDNEHFRALRWNDDGKPFSIGYDSAFKETEAIANEHEAGV